VHAGTSISDSGEIVTSGGRVLGAVGIGSSLNEAAERAYQLCDQVDFNSKYFRRDIGHQELKRT